MPTSGRRRARRLQQLPCESDSKNYHPMYHAICWGQSIHRPLWRCVNVVSHVWFNMHCEGAAPPTTLCWTSSAWHLRLCSHTVVQLINTARVQHHAQPCVGQATAMALAVVLSHCRSIDTARLWHPTHNPKHTASIATI
jgi:hypothetical protein